VGFLWAFGDGVTSTLASPAHAYAAPGTYTVTLTATNAFGAASLSREVGVPARRWWFPFVGQPQQRTLSPPLPP
jgi:hypothetical protein